MKIGFSGTREGMTDAQKKLVREEIWGTDELHHGDCFGADAEAHDIAEESGVEPVIHPPSDPKLRAFKTARTVLPPKPYRDRNADIVRDTDRLIAAPGSANAEGSGTWMTVRIARKAGKPVMVILPDGRIVR